MTKLLFWHCIVSLVFLGHSHGVVSMAIRFVWGNTPPSSQLLSYRDRPLKRGKTQAAILFSNPQHSRHKVQ